MKPVKNTARMMLKSVMSNLLYYVAVLYLNGFEVGLTTKSSSV